MSENLNTKNDTLTQLRTVSYCRLFESSVIKCPIGILWEMFRGFNWDKAFPSNIKNCKFLFEEPCLVGSLIFTEYQKALKLTFRLSEFSDIKRKFSIELVDSEPESSFSSMFVETKLIPITIDNTTLVTCETIYSSDVNDEVLKERREEVFKYISDMKAAYEKTI